MVSFFGERRGNGAERMYNRAFNQPDLMCNRLVVAYQSTVMHSARSLSFLYNLRLIARIED